MAKEDASTIRRREYCSRALRALSDETRFKVVVELMSGPKSVGELRKKLRIEQSLLSHHLKILRDHKLLETRRAGKGVQYRLSDSVGAVTGAIDLGCCRLSFGT